MEEIQVFGQTRTVLMPKIWYGELKLHVAAVLSMLCRRFAVNRSLDNSAAARLSTLLLCIIGIVSIHARKAQYLFVEQYNQAALG